MKIIFLDVDGVLNRDELFARDAGYVLDPIGEEHLAHLKHIINETGAQIVLSSSWRCAEHARQTISRGLATVELEFIDKTPVLRASLPRAFEIQQWLDEHPEVTEFAILDDDPDANIEGHFFQTQFKDGLTEEVAQAVIEHFNAEPQGS